LVDGFRHAVLLAGDLLPGALEPRDLLGDGVGVGACVGLGHGVPGGSDKRIDDLDACLLEVTAVPGDDCESVNKGGRCDQTVLDPHGSTLGAKLSEEASPA